jgi:hypothetical protein
MPLPASRMRAKSQRSISASAPAIGIDERALIAAEEKSEKHCQHVSLR